MKTINETRKELNELDKEMSILFKKRMKLVKDVIDYKIRFSLPILDPIREQEVIDINLNNINDEELKKYYLDFIKEIMKISKEYQQEILENKK